MQVSDEKLLEENRRLVRMLYEDCINRGKMDLLTQLVSEDFVGPNEERGSSGFANSAIEPSQTSHTGLSPDS